MKCAGRSIFSGERIEIEFSRTIDYIDPVLDPSADDGTWIAPGFIDLQMNGFAGADYNSPDTSLEAIASSLRAVFSTGVTRVLPTVITGDPDRMLAALRNLARAHDTLEEGAAIEGFHLEGPCISPEDGPRGAHPARWVRPPNLDEFRGWQEATQGRVRLVTLAPEWPDAPRFIEALTGQGVVVSIGHTEATPGQIHDAVRAGATLSTHLGNAAPAFLSWRHNSLCEQLAEDRLAASFIVDHLHLSEAFLRVALRAKGVERSLLITDAVAPAMCTPGPYRLGEVAVELLADDRVVVRGGTRLAGSCLRMNQAIANVIRRGGVTLREAVTMATLNPARVGRVRGRLRGLQPGERADLVRFRVENGGIRILETFVEGRRYPGPGSFTC